MAVNFRPKTSWVTRLTGRGKPNDQQNQDGAEDYFRESVTKDDEYCWTRSHLEKLRQDFKFWKQHEVQHDFSLLDNHSICPLFQNCMTGDVSSVKVSLSELIGNRNLASAVDIKGRNCLHLAAAFNHVEMVEFLVNTGLTVDDMTEDKFTPLMCAAATGNTVVLKYLIAQRANVNFGDGKSALHWAIVADSISCVENLILARAMVKSTNAIVSPVILAAALGRSEILQYLILHGANVHDVQDKTLNSVLHFAASVGSEDCIALLVDSHRISPHIRNAYGETPLHLAETEGVTRLLLEKGANPDAVDIHGMTPLHCAIMTGDMEFLRAKKLVHHKANVNIQDKNGQTPLHLAAKLGSSCKVCYLLRNGANSSISDNKGMSSYSLMKRKMPHITHELEHSLNSALTITQSHTSEFDCLVALDFTYAGMIAPPLSDHRRSKIIGSPSFLATKSDTLAAFHKMETTYLNTLVCEKGEQILTHPLMEAFVCLKWKKVNYVFYVNFLFYFLMAILYTYFTMEAYLRMCPDVNTCQNEDMPVGGNCSGKNCSFPISVISLSTIHLPTMCLNSTNCGTKSRDWNTSRQDVPQAFNIPVGLHHRPTRQNVRLPGWSWGVTPLPNRRRQDILQKPDAKGTLNMIPLDTQECDIHKAAIVSWCFLALCTLWVLLKELTLICRHGRLYFMFWEKWGQWAIVVSICVTSYWDGWTPCKCTQMQSWHYTSAAAGLLISWAMLLVRISRFPLLGIYVQMLVKVLRNFFKFIIVYVSLLNAFALAFCLLFPTKPVFSSYLQSMLKVFTMMTGELDYQDLFYGTSDESSDKSINSFCNKNDTESIAGGSPNTEDSMRIVFGASETLQYPLAAHALYCLFTTIMTISLMNLLVALAVSDIQSLKKGAKTARLCTQVRSLYELETFLFSNFIKMLLPRSMLACLKRNFLLQADTKRCRFFFRPNDPEDKTVSADLKIKIVEILEKRAAKTVCEDCFWKNKFCDSSVKEESISVENTADVSELKHIRNQLEILQQQLHALSATLTQRLDKA